MLVPTVLLKTTGVAYADDGAMHADSLEEHEANKEVLNNIDPKSGIKVHSEGPKRGDVKTFGEYKKDHKLIGRVFEPNSLHPPSRVAQRAENIELFDASTQGGIIANATRTPKDFKFVRADHYGLAIAFDKYKEICEEQKKEWSLEEFFALPTGDGMIKRINAGLPIYGRNSIFKSKYFRKYKQYAIQRNRKAGTNSSKLYIGSGGELLGGFRIR